jgi:hypothetical protein
MAGAKLGLGSEPLATPNWLHTARGYILVSEFMDLCNLGRGRWGRANLVGPLH